MSEREEMRTIYLLGNLAVCPSCSGTIHRTAGSEDFTCINCHKVFTVVDVGRTDNELVIQELRHEQSAKKEDGSNGEGTDLLLHEISDSSHD